MPGNQLVYVTEDGLALAAREWGPDRPRLVVALVHGYGEHSGRYRHVAEALAGQGMALIGADLRGHGHSDGRPFAVRRFADYHHDVDAILGAARARADGAPVVLLGHSMGGLAALDWLLAGDPGRVDGLVLSSPLLGLARWQELVGPLVGLVQPGRIVGSGLDGAAVTRDRTVAKAYDADPLSSHGRTPLGWVRQAVLAARRVRRRAAAVGPPTLLVYAGADRAVRAAATRTFAAALPAERSTVRCWPAAGHELFNELPEVRREVLALLLGWLDQLAADHAAGAG